MPDRELRRNPISLDGVSWPTTGGDIDLVAGSNVTITPNNTNKTITLASSGGGGSVTGLTTVNTVMTDLKALTGMTNGQVVYALARSTVNPIDGGGGFFIYDTNLTGAEAAVPGLVFKPNGVLDSSFGRWRRVRPTPSWLNVLWFGAKGDDAGDNSGTNDTAAIQAALDYAVSVTGRETVYLPFTPSGGYIYKTTAALRMKTQTALVGEFNLHTGPEISYYGPTGTNAVEAAHTLGEGSFDLPSRLEIRGIRVKDRRGAGAGFRTGSGLHMGSYSNDLIIEKCQVEGFQDCIYIGNKRAPASVFDDSDAAHASAYAVADLARMDTVWTYGCARYGINVEVIDNMHTYRHLAFDTDPGDPQVACIRIGNAPSYSNLHINGVKHEDRKGIPIVLMDHANPPATRLSNISKTSNQVDFGGSAYTGAVVDVTTGVGYNLQCENIINRYDNARYLIRVVDTSTFIYGNSANSPGGAGGFWRVAYWAGGSGAENVGYYLNRCVIMSGSGSPEGSVNARRGSIYMQYGGTDATAALWIKQTDAGNTGWVSK